MKTIEVRIQNNYGVNAIYPVCGNAKTFALIAGTKTLSRMVLENIKLLGYEVINVTEAVAL